MAELNGYKDLFVWQRAVQISVSIYKTTATYPKEETYGLTSQLRRAGVSVASNIAEGWGRQSDGEYKQFLGIARGSNYEIQTQLFIAEQLGFGERSTGEVTLSLSNEVSKMLASLMKTV